MKHPTLIVALSFMLSLPLGGKQPARFVLRAVAR
jgi:hypothetical protein